ncbi:hypothetical protein [Chryseobacterium sp.]|uniref:hypothetical protein n=1 Tax=Chryseobacterium sp. TaxID=1871047 RepID=UPI00321B4AEB
MKVIYLTMILLLFSCSKSVDDRCFVDKINPEDIAIHDDISQAYTPEQILKEKPGYLEIINLTKYRSFKEDSTSAHSYGKEFEGRMMRNEVDFKEFDDKFNVQFGYISQQKVGNIQYAVGVNNLGYWLLKMENGKPSAYFLGLSFSHYYLNKIQEQPIIEGEYLQVEGSFVKIIKVGGLPGYDDYSAIEDGKLFKIKLKDLMQDTDRDGYNDIFEKSFGLNEHNKDTDGDGMNDFEDMNPMFKSEKNKFTQLYELLLSNNIYGNGDWKKINYTFSVFQTDCDYFHKVSPEFRILFIPEDKKRQPYYIRVTDITEETISPIQKNKMNPNSFYIYKSGNSYKNDYSADFEDGKWILKVVGGYVI